MAAGRPASLTRERIIQAVVELLERNSAEPVTTRLVGEALEVHPTALYRHFRDMDELVRAAADQILADLVPADAASLGFGAGGAGGAGGSKAAGPTAVSPARALDAVATTCRALRRTLLSHPSAARVMASAPSLQLNERRLTEYLLALLVNAGLPDSEAALAYHALVEYTVGSATIDYAIAVDGESLAHENWRSVYRGSSPQVHPVSVRLAEHLYPNQDDQFEYGLGLMIASLRTRCGVVEAIYGL